MTLLHPRQGPAAPPTVAEATADVRRHRGEVARLRRLVAKREAGAAELAVAEYRLNNALRRLDAARAAENAQGGFDPGDAA